MALRGQCEKTSHFPRRFIYLSFGPLGAGWFKPQFEHVLGGHDEHASIIMIGILACQSMGAY